MSKHEITGMTWYCPHCRAENQHTPIGQPRYQCGGCGRFVAYVDISELHFERQRTEDEQTPETDPDDPRDFIQRSIDRELRRQYGE